MKRLVSLLMVMVMLLSFGSGAFASECKIINHYDQAVEIKMLDGTILSQEEFIEYLNKKEDEIVRILDESINNNYLNRNIENINGIDAISVLNSGVMELVEGTWWIPGIGQVVITFAGVIIIGDTVIKAGTWLYDEVVQWFAARAESKYEKLVDSIPSRFRNGNVVDVGKFNKRIDGNTSEEKGGWRIEKDRGNNPHGGSKWKLKSPKDVKKGGKSRTATLNSDGKILRD